MGIDINHKHNERRCGECNRSPEDVNLQLLVKERFFMNKIYQPSISFICIDEETWKRELHHNSRWYYH